MERVRRSSPPPRPSATSRPAGRRHLPLAAFRLAPPARPEQAGSEGGAGAAAPGRWARHGPFPARLFASTLAGRPVPWRRAAAMRGPGARPCRRRYEPARSARSADHPRTVRLGHRRNGVSLRLRRRQLGHGCWSGEAALRVNARQWPGDHATRASGISRLRCAAAFRPAARCGAAPCAWPSAPNNDPAAHRA